MIERFDARRTPIAGTQEAIGLQLAITGLRRQAHSRSIRQGVIRSRSVVNVSRFVPHHIRLRHALLSYAAPTAQATAPR
jgi:hypothetical protein